MGGFLVQLCDCLTLIYIRAWEDIWMQCITASIWVAFVTSAISINTVYS